MLQEENKDKPLWPWKDKFIKDTVASYKGICPSQLRINLGLGLGKTWAVLFVLPQQLQLLHETCSKCKVDHIYGFNFQSETELSCKAQHNLKLYNKNIDQVCILTLRGEKQRAHDFFFFFSFFFKEELTNVFGLEIQFFYYLFKFQILDGYLVGISKFLH